MSDRAAGRARIQRCSRHINSPMSSVATNLIPHRLLTTEVPPQPTGDIPGRPSDREFSRPAREASHYSPVRPVSADALADTPGDRPQRHDGRRAAAVDDLPRDRRRRMPQTHSDPPRRAARGEATGYLFPFDRRQALAAPAAGEPHRSEREASAHSATAARAIGQSRRTTHQPDLPACRRHNSS